MTLREIFIKDISNYCIKNVAFIFSTLKLNNVDTLYKAHDNGGYHQKLKQQKMSDDDNDKDESLRRKSLLFFNV